MWELGGSGRCVGSTRGPASIVRSVRGANDVEPATPLVRAIPRFPRPGRRAAAVFGRGAGAAGVPLLLQRHRGLLVHAVEPVSCVAAPVLRPRHDRAAPHAPAPGADAGTRAVVATVLPQRAIPADGVRPPRPAIRRLRTAGACAGGAVAAP